MQVAGTATKTAVMSGNWTATATWGGSLPSTDDRVLIPVGITVIVNTQISTEFKSIRIDGVLKFFNNVNTELRTEYLFSNMTGRLEIGTSSNPINANVTAKLVFADRGGTTTTQDPDRFAPGAVLMGPVEMRGEAKTSWTTLGIQPNAGASTLTLGANPTNWKTGDKLVIAGTVLGDPTSDEVVEISSISDNTIQLNSTLTLSHQAPAQANDLEVHVANLTRNIKISSENPSVADKRRGHIMFMHNLNIDMRYVELTNTGRTDKSEPLDDYIWDDLQEERDYNPPRGAFNNPRGRYSIHFHRGGFDPALTPAHVEGVTVNNDPGWGYVNHSSRVDFIKNVSYDIVGGAFNTEAGDETGSFIENIALRTVNPIDPFADLRSEDALNDVREEFQDFAWQGDAFWFHSTGISVEGNIASGVSGHAFIFWPEGLIEKGLGMRRGDTNLHITDPAQRALLNGVPNDFVLECWLIPQKTFKNNTAYTVTKGLVGFYMQTRFLDTDDFKYNVPTEAYRNSLELVFEGTTLWNIKNKGIEMLYSSDVTIKNSRIIGYGSPNTTIGIDVDHWHNLDDWSLSNNQIEGFNNSNVALSTPTNANITIDGSIYNNTATDIQIRETNFIRDAPDNPSPTGIVNRNLTISNMTFINPNNNIVLTPTFSLNQVVEDGFDFSEEDKFLYYFALGDNITLNYGPFQNATLYFDQQAANFVPITNANFQLEVIEGDPASDVIIPTAYRNKTNAQLQNLTNPSTSFGGELLPNSAVGHASIIGGKVSAISVDPCSGVTPTSPTSVTATNNNCTSIGLSWTATECTNSYQLERKVDNESWLVLNAMIIGTSLTDNAPAEGNNTYRVRAQNQQGNSSYATSNVIDCTVNPMGGCSFSGNQMISNSLPIGITSIENNLTLNGQTALNQTYTYTAGQSITLTPNFHAIAGSSFLAKIEPCPPANLTTEPQPSINLKSRTEQITIQLQPNPANYETAVRFHLPKTSSALLQVYNSSGMLVQQLLNNERIPAGNHSHAIRVDEQQSGLYYVLFRTANAIVTKKLMVVK